MIQVFQSRTKATDKLNAIELTPAFKGQIRDNELSVQNITLKQLKKRILDGFMFNFGSVDIKTIMALDIDNKGPNIMTIDTAIKILNDIDIEPVFIFSTLSSTDKIPRFRIIFSLDKPVEDDMAYKTVLRSVVDYINSVYPDSTDISTCSAKGIFYPCSKCLYQDYKATSVLETLKKLSCLINPTAKFTLNFTAFFTEILKKLNVPDYMIKPNEDFDPICFHNEFAHYTSIYTLPLLKNTVAFKRYRVFVEGNVSNSSFCSQYLKMPCQTVFKEPIELKTYLSKNTKRGQMRTLFGYKPGEKFKNIFHSYNDTLGTILQTDTGYEEYFVVKEENNKLKHLETYTTIDLFGKLFNKTSFKDIMDSVHSFCNITLDRHNSSYYKSNLIKFKSIIKNKLNDYPNIKNILNRNDESIKFILLVIIDLNLRAYDVMTKNDRRAQVFANNDVISAKLRENYNIQLKPSTIAPKVSMLAEMGLIKRLEEFEYNSYISETISKYRRINHYGIKMTSAIEILDVTIDMLNNAENKAKYIVENNLFEETFRRRNTDNLISETNYIIADNYIKEKLEAGAKYIFYTDITRLFRTVYPDIVSNKASKMVMRYCLALAQNNDLNIKMLTKDIVKQLKISDATIKNNRYAFNKTKLFIKN